MQYYFDIKYKILHYVLFYIGLYAARVCYLSKFSNLNMNGFANMTICNHIACQIVSIVAFGETVHIQITKL